MKIDWTIQRGYSISAQLSADGLSFEAFDLIKSAANHITAEKVKGKIVGRLAKDLSADCEEQGLKLSNIRYGCYCIGVGTGFELDYSKGQSRILYIGSGAVFNRIKSHLRGKLFEFARALNTIPLRFYICDLTDAEDGKALQRTLEQGLLEKFRALYDDELPLLNKNNAKVSHLQKDWAVGWDRPLQKDRGRNTTNWLLKPADMNVWKGALQ